MKEMTEMKDTIYRADAIEAVRKSRATDPFGWAVDALKALPSADAVQVVRCKDCKWAVEYDSWSDSGELYCAVTRCDPYDWGAPTWFYVGKDEFCSRGERKGGDDE